MKLLVLLAVALLRFLLNRAKIALFIAVSALLREKDKEIILFSLFLFDFWLPDLLFVVLGALFFVDKRFLQV